jgi:putative hydrolases of HD superfamily
LQSCKVKPCTILNMDTFKRITNFLFELNETKRSPRSGWQRIGVKDPESLADHTAVCAQIAYALASMEDANADHAAALALFHDASEVREGDHNWVTRIYRGTNGKKGAALAQIDGLPVAPALAAGFRELEEGKTKEAVVVHDADLLEMALQAKVYEQSGHHSASLFIDGMRDGLKTDSAKKLLVAIEQSNIEDWWRAIPEIAAVAAKIF